MAGARERAGIVAVSWTQARKGHTDRAEHGGFAVTHSADLQREPRPARPAGASAQSTSVCAAPRNATMRGVRMSRPVIVRRQPAQSRRPSSPTATKRVNPISSPTIGTASGHLGLCFCFPALRSLPTSHPRPIPAPTMISSAGPPKNGPETPVEGNPGGYFPRTSSYRVDEPVTRT